MKEQKSFYQNKNGIVKDCADPCVLKFEGEYYLYCTSDKTADFGIKVYKSKDLFNWSEPVGVNGGYALRVEDVWGDKWFWAGDVIYKNGKFYMYYTANEHLGVAVSQHPIGPFIQKHKEAMHNNILEIDGAIFQDDDGKVYIYFVRFDNANILYVAELEENMLRMKEDTITECLRAEDGWEKGENQPQASVAEGANVLKHKGIYYLTYTANHFESIDYAVGYATSFSPLGPWKKFKNNPILRANENIKGPGNGFFIANPKGKDMFYIYHTHCDNDNVIPRKLAIDKAKFICDHNSGEDILMIDGPTINPISY